MMNTGIGSHNGNFAHLMFSTVLHHLKSPENVGMIVRSHVAFGADRIVIVGPAWHLKKRAQNFSRGLESGCETLHFETDDLFFAWCAAEDVQPVAVEIATPTRWLSEHRFGERTALIVGSEAAGLPPEFLARCAATVTIPQYGPAACLNVAVSASLAMYELTRNQPARRTIEGDEYRVR